jgi:hypothetical protein
MDDAQRTVSCVPANPIAVSALRSPQRRHFQNRIACSQLGRRLHEKNFML